VYPGHCGNAANTVSTSYCHIARSNLRFARFSRIGSTGAGSRTRLDITWLRSRRALSVLTRQNRVQFLRLVSTSLLLGRRARKALVVTLGDTFALRVEDTKHNSAVGNDVQHDDQRDHTYGDSCTGLHQHTIRPSIHDHSEQIYLRSLVIVRVRIAGCIAGR
jgi:hypothetical protein